MLVFSSIAKIYKINENSKLSKGKMHINHDLNWTSRNEDLTGSPTSFSGVHGLMVAHLQSGNVSGGQEMAGFQIQHFNTCGAHQHGLLQCPNSMHPFNRLYVFRKMLWWFQDYFLILQSNTSSVVFLLHYGRLCLFPWASLQWEAFLFQYIWQNLGL